MSIEITGAESVEAALSQVSAEVLAKIMPEFKSAADGTLVAAQDLCPYDEVHHRDDDIHLRDSGQSDAIENGYEVSFGNGLLDGGDRAWYIELGTVKMASQAFLGPAFTESCDELQASLEEIL